LGLELIVVAAAIVVWIQPAVRNQVGVNYGVEEKGVDAVVEMSVHVVIGPARLGGIPVLATSRTYGI